jgi:hypothetical protein
LFGSFYRFSCIESIMGLKWILPPCNSNQLCTAQVSNATSCQPVSSVRPPNSVFLGAETDIVHHDEAVPADPGQTIIQAGLLDQPVQNLAIQRIGDSGADLAALAMQAQAEAGAGEVLTDEQDFHCQNCMIQLPR